MGKDGGSPRGSRAVGVGPAGLCRIASWISPRSIQAAPGAAQGARLASLRLVPRHKTVVLGIVSTKAPTVESKADMMKRVETATRYIDVSKLAVSPQCGFASVDTGNPISPAVQEQKLKLIVDVAHDIWGEA